MIGNDVVDLKLASIQSNWQRNGFLTKIFTEEEQAVILSSDNPFQLVWQFWSMKESAYKVYMQQYQKRFFAPKRFRCSLSHKTEGLVVIDNESYRTTSMINDDFIFTEAVLTTHTNIINGLFKLKSTEAEYQSKQLYTALKSAISKKRNIPTTELQLKKNTLGIPKLYQKKTQLDIPFSLSHHGKYGVYSIQNL